MIITHYIKRNNLKYGTKEIDNARADRPTGPVKMNLVWTNV